MSCKNSILIFLFFFPVIALAQIPAFTGRYDVSVVDSVNDSTWLLTGTFADVTGSFRAMDADTGDNIIQRGYDSIGRVVYDRYKIVGIIDQTGNALIVNVQSDFDSGVVNYSKAPLSGSFPIAAAGGYRPSMYQNMIDPDYDAGIDNLNLQLPNRWSKEVSVDNENNWVLPFALKPKTIIYNGEPLRAAQWSGEGSTILTVNLDVRKYDHLIILN